MNYKTTCPRCGGNDFYVTPHNGMGYCFHCTYLEKSGESREVTQLTYSIEAVRGAYKYLADYYQSSLTETARTYLNSRGFDDATIQRLKLGYITEECPKMFDKALARDTGLFVEGKSVLAGRISFPYLVKDAVTDIRGRSLDKTNPVKYKSPLGSSEVRGAIFPYNFNDAYTTHVVTEGEIKAAISSQAGIPAVALPGIVSWRPRLRCGEKQVIVFDSTANRSTREITFRAIDSLSSKLVNPYVAMLPLRGNEKMDIDTYILTYGEEEYRLIIQNALPYNEWAILQRRPNVH